MEDSENNLTIPLNMNISCPEFTEFSSEMLTQVSFWVEGALSCSVAMAGFLGNVGSVVILSGKEMRNSFNWLLIGLACFDNVYLLGSILESFRKDFEMETHTHVILFPYLFYPMQTIAMTGSILMTVAIAFERYMAVHYPINYSNSANDVNALRKRIIKFLFPVCGLSLIFNVTKFFEATYKYVNTTMPMGFNETVMDTQDFVVETVPVLEPTALRTNPTYSIYFNWFRFLVIGVVPFVLLVLLYAKIYQDIQNRRKNSQYRKKQAEARLAQSSKKVETAVVTIENGTNGMEMQVVKKTTVNNPDIVNGTDQQQPIEEVAKLMDDETAATKESKTTKAESKEKLVKTKGTQARGMKGKIVNFSANLIKTHKAADEDYEDYESSLDEQQANGNVPAHPEDDGEVSTTNAMNQKRSRRSILRKTKAKANAKRRRMEDQMASIFMGYILVFLICHSPRLMLNIYELATIREAVECSSAGQQPFPAWSLVVMCFSHLFLVVNSSINILVYCVMSTKFREEACKMWRKITKKYFNCRNNESILTY